jgi:predicted adenylyl cyclase CyaB
MTEIEIKAHVANPEETERTVRGFAEFERETIKSDTYWKQSHKAHSRLSDEASSASTTIAAATSIASIVAALIAVICVLAGAGKEIIILVCLCATVLTTTFTIFANRKLSGECSSDTTSTPLKIRVREEAGVTVVTYKKKEIRGDTEINDEKEFSIGDRVSFEVLAKDLGFAPYIRKEKKTKTFAYRSKNGTPVSIELSLVTGLGWFIELEILEDEPDAEKTSKAQATLKEVLALCEINESAIETRYYTDMLTEARAGKKQSKG